MWKYKRTLASRVTLWITLMSLGLFIILSFLTLLVTLSAEDSMIHNVLRQVNQKVLPLNGKVKRISYQQLIDMRYPYMTKEELATKVGGFGEFEVDDTYYHFMILEGKVLLLDSSELIVDQARINRILKMLAQAFIPFLLFSLFLARLISKRALKPFFTLKSGFLNPDKQAVDLEKINHQIKETDVKTLVNELAMILAQKEQVLAQQITFNQGMSHELRTPLQVMEHSVELIGLKDPNLAQQDVYVRLLSAVGRMKRISEAMLWLNSQSEFNHPLQVNHVLVKIKQDVLKTFNNHGLTLNIEEQDKLLLSVPEEVFELIIYSLVNNVIRHGKDDDGTKTLTINITENGISFSNLVDQDASKQHNSTTNFKLGLLLVSKLCQRFGLNLNIETAQGQFLVRINKRV
ncbi:sensor histidine kinase [Psychrosphaera aquimarina]